MELFENLKKYRLILGSQSPRRQYLLAELGLPFEVMSNHDQKEEYPEGLSKEEIPVFLAQMKAGAILPDAGENALLITADTIVWCDGKVVNKPGGLDEARKMLENLSGRMHEVHTGVCLSSQSKTLSFHARTNVWFAALSCEEIEYYVDAYKPLDKAGAYGIQEWIGFVGVERIEGSYFNVMGLPVQGLYQELKKF